VFCFGTVMREKVSAITNIPKFSTFWRVAATAGVVAHDGIDEHDQEAAIAQ
jgi:hypothetical protein